uniref:Uncharacterized protein n=1 Tax=Anguilla anguilla TaxID=7936 RepID=A0A0E9XUH3_ANGAN
MKLTILTLFGNLIVAV